MKFAERNSGDRMPGCAHQILATICMCYVTMQASRKRYNEIPVNTGYTQTITSLPSYDNYTVGASRNLSDVHRSFLLNHRLSGSRSSARVRCSRRRGCWPPPWRHRSLRESNGRKHLRETTVRRKATGGYESCTTSLFFKTLGSRLVLMNLFGE
jgi:hypothetical protein